MRAIPPLIWDMQRKAKHRRQVFVTTHSQALLQHESIDPREVLRLEPSANGTAVLPPSEQDLKLVEAGYLVAETLASRTRPAKLDELLAQ